jgi:hypothetical protein
MKNSMSYLKEATALVRKDFRKNFWSIIFFNLAIFTALFTVVLTPFVPLYSQAVLVRFVKTGKIDLFAALEDMNITFERFFKLLVLGSLVGVIVGIGLVLLYIPGIILSFALAPIYFLALKEPNVDPGYLVNKTMEAMKGKKARLFVLQLVSGIVVSLVLSVAALLNIIPIIGTIFYLLIFIAGIFVLQVVQILFFMDVFSNEKKSVKAKE